jgi:hypothetical protein
MKGVNIMKNENKTQMKHQSFGTTRMTKGCYV